MKCEILTFTTAGHLRLALNLAESLRKLGLDEWLTIVAGDDESERVLSHYLAVVDSAAHVRRRVALHQSSADRIGEQKFGEAGFSLLMAAKVDLLVERTRTEGRDFEPFLYVDADCSFVSDPFEGSFGLGSCVAVAPSTLWAQSDRNDFEAINVNRWDICAGVMFVPAVEVLPIFRLTAKYLSVYLERGRVPVSSFCGDQACLNQACQFLAYEPRTLSPAHWKNGARPWGDNERRGIDPRAILVHANWVVGVVSKEAQLRAWNQWHVSADLLRELSL